MEIVVPICVFIIVLLMGGIYRTNNTTTSNYSTGTFNDSYHSLDYRHNVDYDPRSVPCSGYISTSFPDVPVYAPIIERTQMGRFTAFSLGFLLCMVILLTSALSYLLFCPHSQRRIIIITPEQQIPNINLPSIPNTPFPVK